MKIKNLFAVAAICLIAFSAYSTEKNEVKATEKSEAPVQETIVGVAASNENFSTLVTAVKAAGLVETLNGTGPFTVFAPTNEAFGKLPEGTVESLVQPENKDKLTAILTYHVVAGNFDAAAVLEAIKSNNGKVSLTTVQGNELTASLVNGSVVLTDAQGNSSKVVQTDVGASNGVIHVIDSVVMP